MWHYLDPIADVLVFHQTRNGIERYKRNNCLVWNDEPDLWVRPSLKSRYGNFATICIGFNRFSLLLFHF